MPAAAEHVAVETPGQAVQALGLASSRVDLGGTALEQRFGDRAADASVGAGNQRNGSFNSLCRHLDPPSVPEPTADAIDVFPSVSRKPAIAPRNAPTTDPGIRLRPHRRMTNDVPKKVGAPAATT